MRTPLTALLAAVLALALGACGAADEVRDTVESGVEQARELAEGAAEQAEQAGQLVTFCVDALQVVDAVRNQDWDGAVAAGADLADSAPDEIRPEAQRVLDGVEAYRDGNEAAVQSAEFQQAAEDLRAYTTEHCDPRG